MVETLHKLNRPYITTLPTELIAYDPCPSSLQPSAAVGAVCEVRTVLSYYLLPCVHQDWHTYSQPLGRCRQTDAEERKITLTACMITGGRDQQAVKFGLNYFRGQPLRTQGFLHRH